VQSGKGGKRRRSGRERAKTAERREVYFDAEGKEEDINQPRTQLLKRDRWSRHESMNKSSSTND
jgi:hypothetical protein